MTCIYHRIRTKNYKKYGYCTLFKKEVSIFNCKCESIEYKQVNSFRQKNNNLTKLKENHDKLTTIKKRSYKLAKTEKNRFSIIYQDLDFCAICGDLATDKHEVFPGAYRQASMRYGCVIPLCRKHHNLIHSDRQLALKYKIMFEDKFIELYGYDEFMSVFKKDYRI